MSQNKVSAVLAAQALTNITTALTTIRTNLPFLVSLTPEERRSLARAGTASQGMLLDGLTFVAQHPEALPASFPTAEYNKDGALLAAYAPIAAAIAQLHEDVDDTLLALNSDLYVAFLDVYAYAKAANRNGAYDSFLDAVKGRFARAPRKSATTPPPTP